MTVKELMERAGTTETGRAIAYIKDALAEINTLSETHTTKERIDINKDQRLYTLPKDCVKVLDIRCKHQNNSDSKYRSIPRSIHEPSIVDEDGI